MIVEEIYFLKGIEAMMKWEILSAVIGKRKLG